MSMGYLFVARLIGLLSFVVVAWPMKAYTKPRVDAVLLVDTSASMLTTDPHNYRLDAIKTFVGLLDQQDRLALVGFDGVANVISPFIKLTESAKLDLIKQVDQRLFPQGGYTNLSDPIVKSLALIEEGRSSATPILILLTDGKMDTGDGAEDSRLKRELEAIHLPKLKDRGIRLYGLAFSRGSDVQFMTALTSLSQGFSRIVEDPHELSPVFAEIFEAIKEPDLLPVHRGGFTVDGAVDSMSVVKHGVDGAAWVLRKPSGERYAGSPSAPSNALVTVDHPQAGVWTIEGDDGHASVFAESPTALAYRIIGQPPTQLEFWLEQASLPDGNAQAETQAGAEIKSKSRLSDPPSALAVASLGSGVYRATLPNGPAANYEIKLFLKTPSLQREKRIVLTLGNAVDTFLPPATTRPGPDLEHAGFDAGVVEGLRQLLWLNLLVLTGIGAVFWVRAKWGRDKG